MARRLSKTSAKHKKKVAKHHKRVKGESTLSELSHWRQTRGSAKG